MIFACFDTRVARAFGVELAHAFVARLPADKLPDDRKFEAKARSALAQLGRTVAEFKRAHRLNAYQKAQLGNTFKWELKEAGYGAAYVDKLTELLMLELQ